MEKFLWERKIWKRIAKASFYFVFFLILVAVIIIGNDIGKADEDMGRHIIFVGILLTFIDAALTGTFIEMAFHLENLENKLCEVLEKMPKAQPEEDGCLDKAAKIAESERKGGSLGRAAHWQCIRCNCVNPSYVTTCKCGMSKAESESSREKGKTEAREARILKDSWICKSCGIQNPANVFVCKCGMRKSINNGESVAQSAQVQESVEAMRTSLNMEAEKQEAEKREKERQEAEKREEAARQETARNMSARQETEDHKALGRIEAEQSGSANGVQTYANIDAYGNPYYYDQNGVPYYIAPDGNAYYYQ